MPPQWQGGKRSNDCHENGLLVRKVCVDRRSVDRRFAGNLVGGKSFGADSVEQARRRGKHLFEGGAAAALGARQAQGKLLLLAVGRSDHGAGRMEPRFGCRVGFGAAQIFLRPLAGYTCIAIVGWLAS